jgi:G3E family GTPase
MKVHLVGGFTGSGKTTAIANACKILSDKNIITSVMKDEEVDYFVADCPNQELNAPYARVTGGCSCCSYTQLDTQIDMLKKRSDHSALFADYGGTCTNLISVLLKPLREYKSAEIEVANFSTFIDAKLLLFYLKGIRVPLSVESKFIWDKHLEEAEILVVNKIDILPDVESETLRILAQNAFSSKRILFQNSLDRDSVNRWVELISSPQFPDRGVKENDSTVNGSGENNLAWLDEEIQIITIDGLALKVAYEFIHKLSDDLYHRELPIEHLKFLLSFNNQTLKLNHLTFLDENVRNTVEYEKSNSVDILVNARVQTSPDELRKILFGTLNQFKSQDGVTIKEKFISYFQQ